MKHPGKVSTGLLCIVLILAFASTASAQVCLDPPSGLVSWWPGDGNANDIADANDGTLRNGATFAAGHVDQAFSFDGVNDFVQIPSAPNLNPSSVTVDAWIKPDRLDGFFRIVSKGAVYDLFVGPDARLRCIVSPQSFGFGVDVPTSGVIVPAGVFSHVACTYDAATGVGKVYLNGTQAGGTLDLVDNNPLVSTSLDTTIGVRGVAISFFDGLIDEVEIFDRALNAAEIQAIFQADSAGKCKIVVIPVDIDIKPGSDPNAINPAGRGTIPVAILTTDTFDATTVSPITVQFGPVGASLEHKLGHLKDVDGDGDLDLVLHFRSQATGIQCSDTEASLIGETFDGQPIQGADSIVTVGCS